MSTITRIAILFLLTASLQAQTPHFETQFQFLSYGAIPTWTGVATGWDNTVPKIHLYDSERYKGHAQYISVALGTGITFAQFKDQVKDPATRKYLPFFLFDLRKKPIVLNGKTHTWAVRIEDYQYQDTDAQITETTLRLLRIVSDYIHEETREPSHGLIVLAGNPNVQPNTRIAPALAQAGFPNQSPNQLIAAMGGKAVQILNPGKGYGYLRYIPKGMEATAQVGPHDIAIYESMPARVPPVNGIITLEPQTPLSHVNLLAKNRGTLNLYALDTSAIPDLSAQIGKLVMLEGTDQRITLRPAKEHEALQYWATQQKKYRLPSARPEIPDFVEFGQDGNPWMIVNVIGSKATNYSRIQKLFPEYVKPGCAVPFYYYDQVLRSSHAADTIESVLRRLNRNETTPEQLEKDLAKIRTMIQAAHVDPRLIQQLSKWATTNFHNHRIRMRSSTNCEDLPGFNGAGLYLSKGWSPEEGPQKLEKKILEIYASLWMPIPFAERAYFGMDHSMAMMALLVNEAFGEEYANGVAVTIPDKTGFAIAINSQWGDSAVTNPDNGQIPEAILFKTAETKTFTTESRSNIHDIFLQPELKASLEELRQLIVKVHKAFQTIYPPYNGTTFGIDIEFKVVKEGAAYKLYLKQTRPLGQVLPE
jgi:hypothetical protein